MLKRTALLLVLLSSSAAWADTWMPPSKKTYFSPDKTVRLTMVPRDIESTLAFFEDKVEGHEPAGAPAGSAESSAIAELERRSASGEWALVWKKPLVNEVAPVEAVVANNGQGLATFDNWHFMGHGPDAIAIYDRDGDLVRKLGLADLFPDWFIAALPRSVSSIHWRGEPQISTDGAQVIVPVVQPTDDESQLGENNTVNLAIRLTDGAPIGLESAEWKKALNNAAIIARKGCASERKWLRDWNAPISAPATGKEEDWHRYLRETQFRTKWSDDPPFADTTVLRHPRAADFQASVPWLEETLTEDLSTGPALRAIGSPDFGRLTNEIERISTRIRPDQLKGVDLVIIADDAHASRIRHALERSGAHLEIIDPKRTFPQIAERVQDESELVVCRAPEPAGGQASLWHAFPFLALGGGILLLRRL